MTLRERDLAVLWHPCAQMQDYATFAPLEITQANGGWLTLANGGRVFDAISSWWCKSLGHAHPRLIAALQAQCADFEHVIIANTTNDSIVRLCERLLSVANGAPASAWGTAADTHYQPGHFSKVFFADNGSTAVEVALKMALQAQAQQGRSQRTRFAALQQGYHGETVGALSVGDCGLYKDTYAPLLFPCTMLGPLPLVSGTKDTRWTDCSSFWPAIQQQLDAEADTLAAIIIEPILQGAGGMRLYSPDLIRHLRTWATAHDVLLIADEIAAGWGRCGTMLASHHAGLDHAPDIVVLSKGLTGGVLPFAAVMTTNALYDVFLGDWRSGRAFLHSNTFAGNALGVAVAHAVLDVYAADQVLNQVATTGPLLRRALQTVAERTGHLTNIRSLGMMAAADLCDHQGQALDASARTGYHLYQRAVEKGALLRPLGDTVYLFPPLTTTAAEIDHCTDVLQRCIAEHFAD